MGTNACWIQVETKGAVDRERLASAIEAYRAGAGAEIGPREWRRLEPLGLEKTGELGHALSEEHGGWVTVCDSERYTADFGLAAHLAERLGVRVRFVGEWSASNQVLERYLGPDGAPSGDEPRDYYDHLDPVAADAPAGWLFLSFREVDPDGYDPGPEPVDDGTEPLEPAETSGALADAVAQVAEGGEDAELLVPGDGPSDRFSRVEIFEAWLVALLLVSSDVARSEQAVLGADPKRFSELLRDWDGLRSTLAERAVVEARRLRAIPDATEPLEALFRMAGDGDVDAARMLEKAAFRARNLVAWRFARAVSDGRQAVASLYRSRVKL